MKSGVRVCSLLAVLAFWGCFAYADDIPVGVISYDSFLIAGQDGVATDAFNVFNATGSASFPPIFPALTAVSFTDATFTLRETDGTTIVVPLGSIDSGPLLDNLGNPLFSLQFPDDVAFVSATFAAILNETTLVLSDGSTVEVSDVITGTILPSTGASLVAGQDSAVVNASTVVVPTPEPATVGLMGLGLLAAGLLRKRR
jgi:hypothetical protein